MSYNDSTDGSTPQTGRRRSYKGLIIGGGTAVVLLIAGGITASIYSDMVKTGSQKENTLVAAYSNGMNYLSNCTTKTKQTANVANAQTAALDKVIGNAVAGQKYDLSKTAGQQQLRLAMVQAYPNMKGLDKTFQDVLATITGCQDDYRNKQSDVLDKVRDLKSWTKSGYFVRMFGDYPDGDLTVTIPGGQTYTGSTALAKMSVPIVDTATSQTYGSGTYNPEDPFASATPTPAPSAS